MFIYSIVLFNDDTCFPGSADNEKVKATRQTIFDEAKAGKISEILRTISDPTRIKIITAISSNELCVCEIALALNLSQSLVSHQLQALRLLDLVKLRKDGRNMHYSLSSQNMLKIIDECQKILDEKP